MPTLWLATLAGIGLLTLLYILTSLYHFLTLHLLLPSHPLSSYKRPGSEPMYALITGASAGIGLGIAQALVKRGFGVILLGHLEDELNQAKTTLRSLSPTASIHLITMNALTATPEQMTAAISSISNLQISILVNNVGGNPITLPAFRLLSTYTCSDVDSVINQNARFMARLTALMLPLLTRKGEGKVGGERKQRSLILNMSSAGLVGLPYLVMYSATKAFNLSFSIGLARELSSPLETQHIDVLAIIPGEVHSQGNSHGVSSAEPTWIEFGECIVQKTDAAIRQGRRELRPWMMHDVKDWIFGVLSEGKKTRELGVVMRGKRDAFNGAWEREVKSR